LPKIMKAHYFLTGDPTSTYLAGRKLGILYYLIGKIYR
jgi:hypothetical protein